MQHLVVLLLLLVPASVRTEAILSAGRIAQATPQFRARLSPVPIDLAMQSAIAGRGTVTATLRGQTLIVTGDFADLKTPATIANLHTSANKGIRGPAVYALTIAKATSGSISGTVELTQEQVDALREGRLYVQVHSEKAPDGNLWGWLLPQERRR